MAYSLTYLWPESDGLTVGSLNADEAERERVYSHLRLCETLDTSILKLSSAYRGEDSEVCCRGLVERRVK